MWCIMRSQIQVRQKAKRENKNNVEPHPKHHKLRNKKNKHVWLRKEGGKKGEDGLKERVDTSPKYILPLT